MSESHPDPTPTGKELYKKLLGGKGLTVMGQENLFLFQRALLVMTLSWYFSQYEKSALFTHHRINRTVMGFTIFTADSC